MSKVTVFSNWRVEVTPILGYSRDRGDDRMRRECKGLLEQVKRHIEFESASVEVNREEQCSFCKRVWEEEDDGKPVCCNAAIDEWQTKHPDSQQFGAGV